MIYDDDDVSPERQRRNDKRYAEKVMGIAVPNVISDGTVTLFSQDGLIGLIDKLAEGNCFVCGTSDMALICPQCQQGPCRKCYEEKGIMSCMCTVLIGVESDHVM